MSTEPTPPLSDKGSREVEGEMSRPPADTAERRRTIEGVREILAWRERQAESRDHERS
jgi:ribonuclease D